MPVNYELFNLSDTGRIRSNNEDYFATYQNDAWLLLILCDGMGGVKGGRTASTVSVKTIGEYFRKNFSEPVSFFKASVAAANEAVLRRAEKQPQLKGMGSTLVLLLYNGKEIYYAHVGDSRLYLFRNNKLVQLTRDHSYVNEMVDRGLIKREEAHNHEYKNRITRCIGQVNSKPDISSVPYKVEENDIFMMCSDGLTDMVEDNDIEKIFRLSSNVEIITKKLIDKANANGGKDNITVQLLRITQKPLNGIRLKEPKKKKSKISKYIFIPVSAVLLLLIIWFGIQNFGAVKKTATKIIQKKQSVKADEAPSIKGETLASEFLFVGQPADSAILKNAKYKYNYYLASGKLIGHLNDAQHTPIVSKGSPLVPAVTGKSVKDALTMLDALNFRLQSKKDSLLVLKLTLHKAGTLDDNLDSLLVKSCSPSVGKRLTRKTELHLIAVPRKNSLPDLSDKIKEEAGNGNKNIKDKVGAKSANVKSRIKSSKGK